MFVYSLSLPFCLIEKIYSYVPKYMLYNLSKSHFDKYVECYFKYNRSLKNNRFYQDKLNNTYIRYLIRNNMYIFVNYIVSSPCYISWVSIKRYHYKGKLFNTYLDYCIHLANEYESGKTKELLSSICKKRKKYKK